MNVRRMDDIHTADVRAADETDRSRIRAELVTEVGRTEASLRWVFTFAAHQRTDHRLIEEPPRRLRPCTCGYSRHDEEWRDQVDPVLLIVLLVVLLTGSG